MRIAVDIVALAVYLVVANPAVSGLAVHEWVSVGLLVVLVVHLSMHADWMAAAIKKAFSKPSLKNTGSLVLAIALLVDLCLATVSGIMLSRFVLPALGLYASGYFVWKPIHAISAKMLLALIVAHLALHADWIVAQAKSRKH